MSYFAGDWGFDLVIDWSKCSWDDMLLCEEDFDFFIDLCCHCDTPIVPRNGNIDHYESLNGVGLISVNWAPHVAVTSIDVTEKGKAFFEYLKKSQPRRLIDACIRLGSINTAKYFIFFLPPELFPEYLAHENSEIRNFAGVRIGIFANA